MSTWCFIRNFPFKWKTGISYLYLLYHAEFSGRVISTSCKINCDRKEICQYILDSGKENWLVLLRRFFFRNEIRFTPCFWIYSSILQKIVHFVATKCMQPQSLAMHLQSTHSSPDRYFWSPVKNPLPLNISYNKLSGSTVQSLSNATINNFFSGQRTVRDSKNCPSIQLKHLKPYLPKYFPNGMITCTIRIVNSCQTGNSIYKSSDFKNFCN